MLMKDTPSNEESPRNKAEEQDSKISAQLSFSTLSLLFAEKVVNSHIDRLACYGLL
jgi:hypothetical protein